MGLAASHIPFLKFASDVTQTLRFIAALTVLYLGQERFHRLLQRPTFSQQVVG